MQDLRASASTLGDENASSSSSFSQMTQAFSQRIAELQQLVCFRVEDSVKHIFVRDIQGIEASVRALEQLFEELRQRTAQELAVLPKARALIQAAQLQQRHLQQISSNLPQHLPSFQTAPQSAAAAAGVKPAGATAVSGVRGPAAATAEDAVKGKAAADKRRRDVLAMAGSSGSSTAAAAPPKWFVTADELSRVPAYMKGRLTLEKVNAALEEVVSHAALCHKQMGLVSRNQLNRVAAEERRRLHDLYHGVESKEAAKGRFWFVETDLRSGTAIRMDKTGKSILMLLRHLGRLQEVRTVLESSGSVSAYVLLPQS